MFEFGINKVKSFALWISALYVLWFTGALLFIANTPHLSDVGLIRNGCFNTSALLPFVKCKGFFGAELIMDLVNIPYLFILVVLTFTSGISRIIGAVIILSPVMYVIWFVFQKYKTIKL